MKILFDITRLGITLGKMDGVTRTAKTLAWELSKRNDCDLRYFAAWSLESFYKAKKVVDDSSLFPKNGYECPRRDYYLYSCVNVLSRLFNNKWLENRRNHLGHNIDGFTTKGLQGVDILFFSQPFYPIPKQAMKHNNAVLLMHDLLAILYPENFPQEFVWQYNQGLQNARGLAWYMCVSEKTKNDLCELGIADPSRMRVIYSAADPTVFYPCMNSEYIRKKHNIPEGPYLLTLARFEENKNLNHVVQCYRQIRAEGQIKDLSLVLAGTRLNKEQKVFVEELKKENILCLDFVEEQDLASLYSGAFAFLYPSIYEGFGLPVLEAMQCGVPVIASNTSSIPEVVGDAGILLDPHDIDGWCQALLKLDNNSSYRQKLITDGLERSKKFSWDKTIEQMIDFFRMII